MKTKQATIPENRRSEVAVYRAVRNGRGLKLIMAQAWAEMQKNKSDVAERLAQEQADAKAKDKAHKAECAKRRAELSAKMEDYSTQLAGVRDILNEYVQTAGEAGNAIALMADVVDRICADLSEFAMVSE